MVYGIYVFVHCLFILYIRSNSFVKIVQTRWQGFLYRLTRGLLSVLVYFAFTISLVFLGVIQFRELMLINALILAMLPLVGTLWLLILNCGSSKVVEYRNL